MQILLEQLGANVLQCFRVLDTERPRVDEPAILRSQSQYSPDYGSRKDGQEEI